MDFTPAITCIEKAKHIGLILPPDADHDVLAAAEALTRFLHARGAYVAIITPLDHAAVIQKNITPSLASLHPLTKEFIISFDTFTSPISQLRYEQQDKRADIILSPTSHLNLGNHVSFREGNIQCDCLIILALPDIEALDVAKLDIPPSLFSETPIIAFDISKHHKQYSEMAFVDPSLSSLTELLYRFFAAIPEYKIPRETATLLLSGILHRTHVFASSTNAATLLSSHELLNHGADYELAYALSRSPNSTSFIALIGRAFARSRTDVSKKMVWTSLTRDDFIITNHSSRDISPVLDRVEKEFPGNRFYILLWQHPQTKQIHAHIKGAYHLLEKLRQDADAEISDTYCKFSHSYESFPEAEQAVTALLEHVL